MVFPLVIRVRSLFHIRGFVMAQRSIKSFFQVKTVCTSNDSISSPIKVCNENKAGNDNNKRKRIRVIESDSEDEVIKEKSLNNVSPSKDHVLNKSNEKVKDENAHKKESKGKKQKTADKKQESEKSPISNLREKVKEEKGEENIQTKPMMFGSMKNNTTSSNTVYDPSKDKYHPIEDAFWNYGERVPYLALAKTFQKIEEISSRLKIVEILSNYFRSVIVLSPDDLLASIYLCLNNLAPSYEALELGVAETYLMKAISQCTGRTINQIKQDAKSVGDLGIVAEQSRSNQMVMFKPKHLNVNSVFNTLKDIASMSGQASVSKKIDKIQTLFVGCRECEARYIIRSLAGKLRIGLAEQSVLQALATACVMTPPNQSYPPAKLDMSNKKSKEEFKKIVNEEALILKNTYCECPNYELIVPVILRDGIRSLPDHCKITPGIPMKPMLAQPTKGVAEVLQRFDGIKFTCEWKYDGERAQIHLLENGSIKIYSRNQEDNTSKYPDIINNVKAATELSTGLKSFIIDTEAVAWDTNEKRILPFQVLSTRKRKDAKESDIKVQVCVFMFDLLYFNGLSLIREPLQKRRLLLKEHFKTIEHKLIFVNSMDANTMDEMQEFLEESVKGNCEGLMVKTLEEDATYEIAKRSRNWLKLKKDYLDGVGDTLDLVVIGGYLGKGKRTGTYGGFLLASYDTENEEYQSICKIGTGFSDESLSEHATYFKDVIIDRPRSYYRYDTTNEPDHWFEAVQVWEVKCADLSLSPVHKAAIGLIDSEKGISLRFPRFLRIRPDKTPEQSTSSIQVAELYNNQDQIKNQKKNTKKDFEEDFY